MKGSDAMAAAPDSGASAQALIKVDDLFGVEGGLGEIGATIKKYDKSGDGFLSKEELRAAFASEIRMRDANKSLQKMVIVGGTLCVLLLLVMFGLTFAVVEISKETHTSDSGLMKSTSGEVVRTVAPAFEAQLDSQMEDELWDGVTKVSLLSPTGSHLRVGVQGFARIPHNESIHGSIIELITAAGAVVVDGTDMSFGEDCAPPPAPKI